MPINEPVKVDAVVSFDDKTVADTKTENDRTYTTQEGIRKATWTAVVAASIYALISAYQGCQMRKATVATEIAAKAAEKQVDLAWAMAEGENAASFKIDEIVPQTDEYWRVSVPNMGKGASPKFDLTYSIIHQSFPDGKILSQSGPFPPISRGEVLPNDPTKGTQVVFDFRTPGYTQGSKQLVDAEETFKLIGTMTYDNGFKRQITEPICWQTYPWTDSKVGWDRCETAQSVLIQTYQKKTAKKKAN
jgi:hypothetical protein